MTDLPPGKLLLYRFGDPDFGWSNLYEVQAPPDAGSSVQMIAMADLGQTQLDNTLQEVVFSLSRVL